MSKTIKKTLKVSSVKRGAGRLSSRNDGTRVPGNLLLNGLWFSAVEWRNGLLGADYDQQTPVTVLKGATIVYDEVTVTPEDLVANPGGIPVLRSNGTQVKDRDGNLVFFKKPGVNNTNMEIDFSTVNITDNLINMSKMSLMYAVARPQIQATPQTAIQAPTKAENITHEVIDDIPAGRTGANESLHDEEPELIPNPDGSMEADGVTPVMIPNPAFVPAGG